MLNVFLCVLFIVIGATGPGNRRKKVRFHNDIITGISYNLYFDILEYWIYFYEYF